MEPKPKRNLSTRVLSIGILASLALAGCTTTAPLSYAPPPNLTVERGQGSVAVGQVTDDREKKSTELGVVRGGYGNVLKRIYSDRPVADEVREALQNGLKARGLLAESPDSATWLLDAKVSKLDCNYYFNKEAHAHLDLSLRSPAGASVFEQGYGSDAKQAGFGAGIFASTSNLVAMTQRVLNEAIDRGLDDDAFRKALATPVAASSQPATRDPEARLEQLRELRDKGLIDAVEYERKREEILNGL